MKNILQGLLRPAYIRDTIPQQNLIPKSNSCLMKYILLFIIVFVSFSNVYGQSITWQRVMNNYGVFKKSQECKDGGYIACGIDRVYPQNLSKIYLVKYNKFGDSVWVKRYDLSINIQFDGFWVQETNDKGFIVGGATDDAYIIKTDSLGNVEWYKIFGGFGIEQSYCIKQTLDNGYVSILRTTSFGTNDIRVIRLDSLGATIWDKTLINNSGHELAYEILIKQNNFFIVGGIGFANILIIKFNYNGDTLWNKFYGGSNIETAYSIDSTDDNGLIIGGFSKSFNSNDKYESYIIKTDSNGVIQWQRVYNTFNNEICASIRNITSKGFVFCGWSSPFEGTEKAFVKIIDKNGELITEKFYAGEVRSNNFYSVENTNDKGFVLSGVAINSNGYPKSYIVKTDSLLYSTPIGIKNNDIESVHSFKLYQNYPNPFNPTTTIKYHIPKDGIIEFKVYDIQGREIFYYNGYKQQGAYVYEFDGSNLATGVYFYQLKIGDNVMTRKMILMK